MPYRQYPVVAIYMGSTLPELITITVNILRKQLLNWNACGSGNTSYMAGLTQSGGTLIGSSARQSQQRESGTNAGLLSLPANW